MLQIVAMVCTKRSTFRRRERERVEKCEIQNTLRCDCIDAGVDQFDCFFFVVVVVVAGKEYCVMLGGGGGVGGMKRICLNFFFCLIFDVVVASKP